MLVVYVRQGFHCTRACINMHMFSFLSLALFFVPGTALLLSWTRPSTLPLHVPTTTRARRPSTISNGSTHPPPAINQLLLLALVPVETVARFRLRTLLVRLLLLPLLRLTTDNTNNCTTSLCRRSRPNQSHHHHHLLLTPFLMTISRQHLRL